MTIDAEAFGATFRAVRDVCSSATWSRGVELSRAGAVVSTAETGEGVCFRVSTRGGMIAPTVTLFVEDADWECNCGSHDDVCEHVAAAVIAFRRSRDDGQTLKSTREAGEVEYRFRRFPGGLALDRLIARGGQSTPLQTTLAAVATGRVDGPRFVASQADLAVELALGTHRSGVLQPARVDAVLRALRPCTAITLDGQPVRVEAEPVLPRVRLSDQGEGFSLQIVDDPDVTEHFANGIVLCGDVLRPVRAAGLTGRELHDLTPGRHFTASQVGELVTEILPSLRQRIRVDIATERLPETVDDPPRVRLEIERDGDVLSVLPTIVYGDPPLARVDGGRLVHLRGPVPVRDERQERSLARKLHRELGLAPGVREEARGTAAVTLSQKLDGWHGTIEGQGREHFRLAAPLEPQVQIDGFRLDVDFVSRASRGHREARADPEAVVRAWRDGESLVPLLGGGWAPLPADWLERHGHRVADLLAARQADGTVPRACSRGLQFLAEGLSLDVPPDLRRLHELLEHVDAIPQVEPPSDLTVPLRGYQHTGMSWLVFLRRAGLGGLLADDMGLGKTLQVLCAVEGRTLVVSPTSVLHNWADEIRKHRPALSCATYHGPGRTLDPDVDVTLTTYAILRLDAEKLGGIEWDTIVLDEAQAIKNPESQVAEAAFGLCGHFRVTLTGTPVENRLDELWSQFHFINRGMLGPREDFQRRYAGPIASGVVGVAGRLRDRIRPFVLRRLKHDVAPDLPPRTDAVLRCELEEPERMAYQAVRAATVRQVVEQLQAGGGVMAALEALLRLRQAACHASLVPGHFAGGSAKLTLLLEMLDSVVAEGNKALVFSQWTSLLDLTEPHLRKAGISFTRLDGSTRDRQGVVRMFQSDGGPSVMLVSLRAGGTGLNLTAADHVFLLDPWWNPAVEQQAADRAHRIGQTRPVMVYRLVAEDTVEERILALQERKRSLAEAALGEADQAASLTRDELLDLLGPETFP